MSVCHQPISKICINEPRKYVPIVGVAHLLAHFQPMFRGLIGTRQDKSSLYYHHVGNRKLVSRFMKSTKADLTSSLDVDLILKIYPIHGRQSTCRRILDFTTTWLWACECEYCDRSQTYQHADNQALSLLWLSLDLSIYCERLHFPFVRNVYRWLRLRSNRPVASPQLRPSNAILLCSGKRFWPNWSRMDDDAWREVVHDRAQLLEDKWEKRVMCSQITETGI